MSRKKSSQASSTYQSWNLWVSFFINIISFSLLWQRWVELFATQVVAQNLDIRIISPELKVANSSSASAMAGFASTKNWVFIWNDKDRIFAKRYTLDGSLLWDARRIDNGDGNITLTVLDVATSPSGEWVVAWQKYQTSNNQILMRCFSADDTPLSSEILLANMTTLTGFSLTSMPFNEWWVSWQTQFQISPVRYYIYVQRCSLNGKLLAPKFKVDNNGTYSTHTFVASSLSDDWVSIVYGSNSGNSDIWLRRFARNGTAISDEILVNNNSTTRGEKPFFISFNSSEHLVAWTGSYVYAQRYNPTFIPINQNFVLYNSTYDLDYLLHSPVSNDELLLILNGITRVLVNTYKKDGTINLSSQSFNFTVPGIYESFRGLISFPTGELIIVIVPSDRNRDFGTYAKVFSLLPASVTIPATTKPNLSSSTTSINTKTTTIPKVSTQSRTTLTSTNLITNDLSSTSNSKTDSTTTTPTITSITNDSIQSSSTTSQTIPSVSNDKSTTDTSNFGTGIGVGFGLAAILAAGGIGFFCYRRHKKQNNKPNDVTLNQSNNYQQLPLAKNQNSNNLNPNYQQITPQASYRNNQNYNDFSAIPPPNNDHYENFSALDELNREAEAINQAEGNANKLESNNSHYDDISVIKPT